MRNSVCLKFGWRELCHTIQPGFHNVWVYLEDCWHNLHPAEGVRPLGHTGEACSQRETWRLSHSAMCCLHTRSQLFSKQFMGPSTLATLFNHMWPRIVAGIFIPVGNHYFQALASTLQFVAQVRDRLWLVPATDRAFAYITYMSPPHVALVCSGPPQCAATCGWTKWPVCSGPISIN